MAPRSSQPTSITARLLLGARQHPLRAVGALFGLCTLYLLFFTSASPTYLPPPLAHRPEGSEPPSHIRASIIVPTYHERDNVRPLVTRTSAALRDAAVTELVLVDDNSQDGTEEEVDKLKEEGYNVRVIVRVGAKGLSSAVLKGFEEARGESLVVMDADLQHPPESVQKLLDALDDPTTPFALGTRYGPDTHMDQNWPVYRRIISWGARLLARPLTSASDPMTGFFGIRKEYFQKTAAINPSGFKIALELLLKVPLPPHGIAEIPYDFGTRSVGESKLSSKVMLRYVGQLWSLYWWSWGFFFPVVLLVLTAAGVFALQQAYMFWQRKRYGAGGRYRRVKHRDEV